MKYMLWIAVAAPMMAVSPCHAAGINLAWNDCSTFGAHAKTSSCSSNSGTNVLVASFVAPPGITQLTGIEAVIDVETNSAVLPDWWRLQSLGCRSASASSSADFTAGPVDCDDYWQGGASGAMAVSVESPSPNRARFRFVYALPAGYPSIGPLVPGGEYYAFKLIINNAKSVGTGACTGCDVGATLVLRYIQLQQPQNASGSPVLVTPASDNTAIWNGGETLDPNFPNYVIFTGPQITPTSFPPNLLEVAPGGSQTFTINPTCYQTIVDLQVDGVSMGPVSSYTFTNVTASHTITATFSPCTITASAGAGGTISPSGDVQMSQCNQNQIFTIVPDPCYSIQDVIVDGTTHLGAASSYTFTNVQANHTIAASFRPQVSTTLPTGTAPTSVAIGDVNGDTWPDLVVANELASTVSVLLGNGTGGFGAKTDFPAGYEPYSVAIGDVSGDGRPDLAVANGVGGSVSVLLGTGGGGFGPATDYYVAGWASSVAIGDVSGDGRPDLAVANNFYGFSCPLTVSVLLGNGDGTFGARTDFGTGGCNTSVAIGDVSGDGRPDLAVANLFSNTVSVLLGTGGGGFAPKTDYSVGANPSSVTIGTLNADGNADLAVANGAGGSVSVLLGTGGGTFAPKTDYSVGANPNSVAIGDWNGDGKSDLVVAIASSDSVSVLIGNGDGTFGGRTDFCTGHAPVSVAIADLNGDGWRDLATANSNANTVSVLLNPRATPVAVEPAPTRLPHEFELFAPRPNPTNGGTTFAFTLPVASRVRVDVFDIAGRRVARLSNDEALQPGPHELVWNGRGSSGARVTSGVYFVRVSAGQRSATRKLVMAYTARSR